MVVRGVLGCTAIPVDAEVSSEQLVRSRVIYTNRWVPMILQKIQPELILKVLKTQSGRAAVKCVAVSRSSSLGSRFRKCGYRSCVM